MKELIFVFSLLYFFEVMQSTNLVYIPERVCYISYPQCPVVVSVGLQAFRLAAIFLRLH